MDVELRRTKRTGDPVTELTALTRMPALRSLPPCRHCGRDLSRVEVERRSVPCPPACQALGNRRGWWSLNNDGTAGRWVDCQGSAHNSGTGRTEWPWHGDAGRLALMAYAGDEAARALVPCECGPEGWSWEACWCNGERPFTAWLRGLDRWPGALLAAGILAGRVVHGPCTDRTCQQVALALDAATEHHHCGCAESREAWHGLVVSGDLPEFCLVSSDVVFAPGVTLDGHPAWLARLLESWKQHDEPTIRAAICAGLAGWARTGVL